MEFAVPVSGGGSGRPARAVLALSLKVLGRNFRAQPVHCPSSHCRYCECACVVFSRVSCRDGLAGRGGERHRWHPCAACASAPFHRCVSASRVQFACGKILCLVASEPLTTSSHTQAPPPPFLKINQKASSKVRNLPWCPLRPGHRA
jgi:hypothetical protein